MAGSLCGSTGRRWTVSRLPAEALPARQAAFHPGDKTPDQLPPHKARTCSGETTGSLTPEHSGSVRRISCRRHIVGFSLYPFLPILSLVGTLRTPKGCHRRVGLSVPFHLLLIPRFAFSCLSVGHRNTFRIPFRFIYSALECVFIALGITAHITDHAHWHRSFTTKGEV